MPVCSPCPQLLSSVLTAVVAPEEEPDKSSVRFALTLHIYSAGKSSAETIQCELTTTDSEADSHEY